MICATCRGSKTQALAVSGYAVVRVSAGAATTAPETAEMPRCPLCHHTPTDHKGMRGLAGSAYDDNGVQVRLCHEDDHSCYTRWLHGERPAVGVTAEPELEPDPQPVDMERIEQLRQVRAAEPETNQR